MSTTRGVQYLNIHMLFNTIFLVFLITTAVEGGLLKLPAPLLHSTKRSASLPCEDVFVVSKNSLQWNLPQSPPWDAHPTTLVYKSPIVTLLFEELLEQRVPGLETETFGSVFRTLREAGCLIYPHGGCVRDFLLGLNPKDIDVDYSCSPKVLYNACVSAFGPDMCFVKGEYFVIGAPDLDSPYELLEGASWNASIFGPLIGLEYTTNTLAYDINGNNVIIDVVGTGAHDTCNQMIRIPVPKDEWEDWLLEQTYKKFNGLSKLPRFWKLRSKPKLFTADEETLNFIENRVQSLWKNTTYPVEMTFRIFYCHMTVPFGNVTTTGCVLNYTMSSETQSKIDNYNTAFSEDIGISWYNQNVVSAGVNSFIISIPVNTFRAVTHQQYQMAPNWQPYHIVFETVTDNPASMYSPTTGYATIKSSGYYLITSTVFFLSSGGATAHVYLQITVNGSVVADTEIFLSGAIYAGSLDIIDILKLSTGDLVGITASTDGTSVFVWPSAATCSFSIMQMN